MIFSSSLLQLVDIWFVVMRELPVTAVIVLQITIINLIQSYIAESFGGVLYINANMKHETFSFIAMGRTTIHT